MKRAARHYLAHLLHRRCDHCWQDGFARGFHRAAVESEASQRRRDRLWEQGINPNELETFIRERAA